jgi:hypothetical protein
MSDPKGRRWTLRATVDTETQQKAEEAYNFAQKSSGNPDESE